MSAEAQISVTRTFLCLLLLGTLSKHCYNDSKHCYNDMGLTILPMPFEPCLPHLCLKATHRKCGNSFGCACQRTVGSFITISGVPSMGRPGQMRYRSPFGWPLKNKPTWNHSNAQRPILQHTDEGLSIFDYLRKTSAGGLTDARALVMLNALSPGRSL